jgi:hypothetical protein
MGQGSGQAHRLTGAERLELQRRVRAGETHAVAAATGSGDVRVLSEYHRRRSGKGPNS